MNTLENGLTQGVVSDFAQIATYTEPVFADDNQMAYYLAAGPVYVNVYGGFFKTGFTKCQSFGYPFLSKADADEAVRSNRFVTALYRITVKSKGGEA